MNQTNPRTSLLMSCLSAYLILMLINHLPFKMEGGLCGWMNHMNIEVIIIMVGTWEWMVMDPSYGRFGFSMRLRAVDCANHAHTFAHSRALTWVGFKFISIFFLTFLRIYLFILYLSNWFSRESSFYKEN